MKPFNLKEYLANTSRKVVTRLKCNIRIVCTDIKSRTPIIAVIEEKDGTENVFRYEPDGIMHGYDDINLFFTPTNHEGFMNIYNRDNKYITGVAIHNTEEEAKRFIFPDRGYITTVKIQ